MLNQNKNNKGLTRRDLLSQSVAGGLALASLNLNNKIPAQSIDLPAPKKHQNRQAPNILWICTDQQRYDTIAALGNSIISTPNLDKLVTESVVFTHAFAQSPVCTPSRASFMTSRYPHLTGARDNGFDIRDNEIPISKIFSNNGYHCGLIGKLHLSSCHKHIEKRIDDGYSEFMWSHGPWTHGDANHYLQWLKSKGYQWKDVYYRPKGKYAYAGVPKKLHQTTWCFEKGIDFINRNKSKPWFLSINVFAPHHPFDPSEEYLKRYDPDKMPDPLYQPGELDNKPPNQTVDHNGAYGGLLMGFSKMTANERRQVTAAYYAMIEQIDDQVGRLMKELEATGQKENTIVIFTSDHGEMLGNHGIYLKGHYPYDDLIHVPLMIRWPGRFKTGLRSNALVELLDIAPTLLDAIDKPIPDRMQGRSLLNICSGQADPHTHRDYVFAERYGGATSDKPPTYLTMIRNRRYKISVYHGCETCELYDLQKDPHEFKNLWNDHKYHKLKDTLIKKCFDAQVERLDPVPQRVSGY